MIQKKISIKNHFKILLIAGAGLSASAFQGLHFHSFKYFHGLDEIQYPIVREKLSVWISTSRKITNIYCPKVHFRKHMLL